MLSNSRIYIFKVSYKGSFWLSVLDANELSGMMANILKYGITDLKFKNIQFINDYKDEEYSCEVHLNKLKYKEKRILNKADMKELQSKLRGQLNKINNFKYEQIHIVNDEFSRIPSTGFLKEDVFYA